MCSLLFFFCTFAVGNENLLYMKINSQSQAELRNALKRAVEHYREGDVETITDFYVQVSIDSGDLALYDDEDNQLSAVTIGEWADHKDEDDQDLMEEICQNIKTEIGRLDEEGVLDNVAVMKPFSFVLVDENKEVVEDLYIKDDEQIMLGGDLLENLDDDLNQFMDKLFD